MYVAHVEVVVSQATSHSSSVEQGAPVVPRGWQTPFWQYVAGLQSRVSASQASPAPGRAWQIPPSLQNESPGTHGIASLHAPPIGA